MRETRGLRAIKQSPGRSLLKHQKRLYSAIPILLTIPLKFPTPIPICLLELSWRVSLLSSTKMTIVEPPYKSCEQEAQKSSIIGASIQSKKKTEYLEKITKIIDTVSVLSDRKPYQSCIEMRAMKKKIEWINVIKIQIIRTSKYDNDHSSFST